jgi:hypothetical protein
VGTTPNCDSPEDAFEGGTTITDLTVEGAKIDGPLCMIGIGPGADNGAGTHFPGGVTYTAGERPVSLTIVGQGYAAPVTDYCMY